MRAALMRQRAGELRAQADTSSADVLSRKARLHDRFARGGDIARPSRFSDAERAQRRDMHRQALAEVSGMHALERDALTQQIDVDEQRMPIVTRELAMRGATGGDTAALHDEQRQVERRLLASRARLEQITPGEGQRHAPATRAAAAAPANERLPQSLRASPYALRHGTDSGSPFVRRIAGAPTQDARDELARSRAVAVQTAQKPADKRPPIVGQRRRGAGTRYRRAAMDRPDQTVVTTGERGDPARSSRARSQTIAMLRARRRQADAETD